MVTRQVSEELIAKRLRGRNNPVTLRRAHPAPKPLYFSSLSLEGQFFCHPAGTPPGGSLSENMWVSEDELPGVDITARQGTVS